MRPNLALSSAFVLFLLTMVMEGCSDKCESTQTYSTYEPVYTSLATIRSEVSLQGPEPIQAVGKIYAKDNYLFVNEPGAGIHIINNQDPGNPQPVSFLKIPGTYDLAIRGNTLYADSYMDLVLFDISDMNDIKESGRLENVFSNYNSMGYYIDPVLGAVTDWKQTEVVQKSDCSIRQSVYPGIYYTADGISVAAGTSFNKSQALLPGGQSTGTGGSMARFTIALDHLYALDASDIVSVDLNSSSVASRTNVSWDMETIFPYDHYLFIGANSGMHIVDIASPDAPSLVSTYQHVTVCDPVVVEDTVAYVTLRSGTECQGYTNQLEAIDIGQVDSPNLLAKYAMTSPAGLGIDNHLLFVCDDGLKVFDASDVYAIDQHMLAHYPDVQGFDIIPFNHIAIMIGDSGIYQYDYSDPSSIKLLSTISIQHEN